MIAAAARLSIAAMPRSSVLVAAALALAAAAAPAAAAPRIVRLPALAPPAHVDPHADVVIEVGPSAVIVVPVNPAVQRWSPGWAGDAGVYPLGIVLAEPPVPRRAIAVAWIAEAAEPAIDPLAGGLALAGLGVGALALARRRGALGHPLGTL